jgi:hypothetical protein
MTKRGRERGLRVGGEDRVELGDEGGLGGGVKIDDTRDDSEPLRVRGR